MATSLAEQVVDSLHEINGRHEGTRAIHAKGILCSASFRASPAGSALTRAAHMQGDEIRATVRFSNAGGDPAASDTAKDGRGLAVKLYLEDGGRTDLVGVTLPCFFVRTPEEFLEFTRARMPLPDTGHPDLEKVGAFLEAHPEALPAIQHAVTRPAPRSYAQLQYNGIHAFRWISAGGEERWVRFSFVPVAGVEGMSDDEVAGKSADYLQEELRERLEHGPVEFSLEVTIGGEGDDASDPTVAWPPERERLTAGTLRVEGLDRERERDGDVLVFDPTRVTDGIELSDDRILRFRPESYAVSVERRSGTTRE